MKKHKILVLNKHYFPIAVEGVQKTFNNIFSSSVIPLDISYEQNEAGCVNINNIEYFNAIQDVMEWLSLPIRSYDDYIHTVQGPIRVPTVVVCTNFDRVVYRKVEFPTKQNILKRDNFTCVYTGKKLVKEELSVDHITPKSLGGLDSWENMVCCDKLINSKKGSKTLKEAGLKLRYKPYKPNNGLTFDIHRDEWSSFLKGY